MSENGKRHYYQKNKEEIQRKHNEYMTSDKSRKYYIRGRITQERREELIMENLKYVENDPDSLFSD